MSFLKTAAFLLIAFATSGCASNSYSSLASAPSRNTASVGSELVLRCERGENSSDVYGIKADNSVDYRLESPGLPMGGRNSLVANWLSKNTIVINGRWSVDFSCDPKVDCEYEYFTVLFNRATGSGYEVTAKNRQPMNEWKSSGKPISCKAQ